ncbi:NifB/NifX family molybdenum-iron cluster-binding protein [Desulforegula conservatrix]|uniref:NifB/NifX family molybdenum-iron cluster-binding protein n=1 Tax=Desulforegula conservatrix TaxID=153026 RepID=UPI00041D4C53|nr:NifB/NifX family molybdenum-iron cluster-binding protein [Desulforegula conservatrix]
MKIAVSSKGTDLTSEIDSRFGRAAFFVVVDSETLDFTAVENTQNLNLPQGAGIQSSKTVAGTGAEIVVTGNCGPKAFTALSAAGIRIAVGCTGRVIDAVQQCKNGLLSFADEANVEGHWI